MLPRRNCARLSHDWLGLVICERLTVMRLVSRLLEKQGCVVEAVDDGSAAVEKAQHFAYDLILMDCQMPQMDGFEVTAAIRREPGLAGRVPIVAVTANAIQGDREKCLAAGMNDYIIKPIAVKDLKRVLEQWGRRP